MAKTGPDARRRLLDQIAALRDRVDPAVLTEAERVAKAYAKVGTKLGSSGDPSAEGMVPYDRDAAREAVRLFLESRTDGGRFRRQLAEKLIAGVGPAERRRS